MSRGANPSSPSTLRAILIPVKSFANAKQRLASRLSLDQRAALARAMMEDVFAAAGQVRGVERVFVVSNERHALAEASARGWESITETAQHSESASVDLASQTCAERGASAVLRLPADLPLVTPADLEALFAELDRPPEASSRNWTGHRRRSWSLRVTAPARMRCCVHRRCCFPRALDRGASRCIRRKRGARVRG